MPRETCGKPYFSVVCRRRKRSQIRCADTHAKQHLSNEYRFDFVEQDMDDKSTYKCSKMQHHDCAIKVSFFVHSNNGLCNRGAAVELFSDLVLY